MFCLWIMESMNYKGEDMKTCTKCKEEKPLTEFYNNKHGKFGKDSRCKSCKNTAYKKWVNNNRDRVNEMSRVYQIENKETIAKRKKERYLENIKNPDYLKHVKKLRKERYEKMKKEGSLLEKRRKHYHDKLKHDDEFMRKKRESNKKWTDSNKEKVAIKRKRFYEKNKEKNLKYGRNAFANLTDGSVRKLLCQGGLSAKDIPQELVDLKRVQILIHREINK